MIDLKLHSMENTFSPGYVYWVDTVSCPSETAPTYLDTIDAIFEWDGWSDEAIRELALDDGLLKSVYVYLIGVDRSSSMEEQILSNKVLERDLKKYMR